MLAPSFERDVNVGALTLDAGVTLNSIVQRVTCYGTPRDDGSNVILVNHALTGSSRVPEWWGGIVGPGRLLDTDRLAIIGINNLGGCYGSTGPASPGPNGEPYGASFPLVTVGDIVRAQATALDALGITKLAAVVGGSLGGMQALTWALRGSRTVEHAIVIGAYDHFTPMGIALNHIAREAIRRAATPESGLELARMIAMLTYKSESLLTERFGRNPDRGGGDPFATLTDRFDVEGYLDYQGRIFSARMDKEAYIRQTRAMDLFDVRAVPLPSPAPRMTFVGIENDWLFPPQYVRAAAERIAAEGADSAYVEMPSNHGHDAFLAETETLVRVLSPRLEPLYA